MREDCTNRSSRAKLAKETPAICERGEYAAPSGRTVSIGDDLETAVRGTVLYTPEQLADQIRGGTYCGLRISAAQDTASRTATATLNRQAAGPGETWNHGCGSQPSRVF